MNALISMNGPLAESLGWTLLHHLWQGTVLALIAAAALRLMSGRSANARYLAACGFLLLITGFPVATAVRLYDSPEPLLPKVTTAIAFADTTEMATVRGTSLPWLIRAQQVAEPLLPWVVAIWLAGVAVLSLRLLVGWGRTRRLGAGGERVSAMWERSLARIAESLRVSRPVRLLQSARIEVPMVIGWVRPIILVPASALTGLTPQQLETIFAHELAHIRRHDYLMNLLQVVAETLFFYHPAVWWMSSRIRVERENCCDDLAVAVCGNAVLYARALTNLEGLRSESVALAANGGSLRSRVMRLVGVSPARCSYRWIAGASILTFVAAIAVTAPVMAAFFGEEPQDPTPPPQPTIRAKPVAEPTPPPQVEIKAPTVAEEVLLDEKETLEEIIVSEPESLLEPDEGQKNLFETVIPGSEIQLSDGSAIRISTDGVITINPQMIVREYAIPALQVAMAGGEHIKVPLTPSTPTPPPPVPRKRWNGELTVDQLIALKAAGVDAPYIRALRSLGYGDLTFEELIQLRRQGVDAQFIANLNAIGLGHIAAADLAVLRNAGVTAEYIEELRDAGLEVRSVQSVVAAKAGGVSGAYIESLRDAGMADLSLNDIIRLQQNGITADFIRALKRDHEE